MLERGIDLVGDLRRQAGAAFGQMRPGLNHEIRNDAVEKDAVVKRLAFYHLPGGMVFPGFLASGKLDEVGHGLGRFLLKELDHDLAH